MAVLGIIGGIAPPPTIHYYRAVVEIYRARSGGRAPRVLINSLDGDEVFSLLSTADGEGLAAVLLDGIQRCAMRDLALFASVSVHVAYESLAGGVTTSTHRNCRRNCRRERGAPSAWNLRHGFTVRSDMFGSKLAHGNIRLVLPTEQVQDDIQRIYFDELVIGRVRSPSRQRLLEIAQRMRAEQLIDGVLLAGTELAPTTASRALRRSQVHRHQPRAR